MLAIIDQKRNIKIIYNKAKNSLPLKKMLIAQYATKICWVNVIQPVELVKKAYTPNA